jgi:hypothetical protein
MVSLTPNGFQQLLEYKEQLQEHLKMKLSFSQTIIYLINNQGLKK